MFVSKSLTKCKIWRWCLHIFQLLIIVFLQIQLWIINYYVKRSSYNLSNKNREMIFQKYIVHFVIEVHVLSWRQQKLQCLCFHCRDYLTNFWCNNWRCRKTLLLGQNLGKLLWNIIPKKNLISPLVFRKEFHLWFLIRNLIQYEKKIANQQKLIKSN